MKTKPIRFPSMPRIPPFLPVTVGLIAGVGGLVFFLPGEHEKDRPVFSTSQTPLDGTLSKNRKKIATKSSHGGVPGPPSPPSSSPPLSTPMEEALSLAADRRFHDALAAMHQVPQDMKASVITSIFALWVDQSPGEAAKAALDLPDAFENRLAWNAVTTRWAEVAPDQLAVYALSMEGNASQQQQALTSAIPHWLEINDNDAIKWVGALPSSIDCDAVISIVAKHEPLIERDPALAITWAEAIRNPVLRSRTLGIVVRSWLPASPEEAANYARNSPNIFPSEREDILVGERFTEHQ
ncbi:MAG: hypothetical protein QM627_01265 [Luteolibacter sp.]